MKSKTIKIIITIIAANADILISVDIQSLIIQSSLSVFLCALIAFNRIVASQDRQRDFKL